MAPTAMLPTLTVPETAAVRAYDRDLIEDDLADCVGDRPYGGVDCRIDSISHALVS